MARIEVVGVPFDGYGRLGNQALAARRVRDAGLDGAFEGHEVIDTGDLDLPPPDPHRAKGSGLINEAALVAMSAALEREVGRVVDAGSFPVVIGGDCSILLGIMAGAQAGAPVGLLFIDGHEDTMPLDVSEDGEAANAELGMLLGITGHLTPDALRRYVAILPRQAVAVLGPRDEQWRRQFNVGSLRDWGTWFRSVDEVAADPAASGRAAVEHLRTGARQWWLHVDLDVLDPDVFPAQGLPGVADEPGGLSWSQLEALLTHSVAAGGCAGWSIAIYDPDQDPDSSGAEAIVRLVGKVAGALPGAR